MRALVREKEEAIRLRKQGLSYQDILRKVLVSKSTLSLWLQDLPLTSSEKHLLKNRTTDNISKGRIRAAASLHQLRERRDLIVFNEAKEEFAKYKADPFFQLGIGLYWAEGSKRSSSFGFTNSDSDMVNVMISWIEQYLGVERSRIYLRLYTHKPFADEQQEEYWSKQTGILPLNFKKTIYKPTGLLVKKRPMYRGCIRVELGSVRYLRKLAYWQQMLIEHYGKER